MFLNLFNTIFIVSYEAGGAEILSSMMLKYSENDYVVCVEGPAKQIFNRKITCYKKAALSDIGTLTSNDLVLTGTSWMPDLERNAIALARDKGLKVFSILDHWTNYLQRFMLINNCQQSKQCQAYLPDKVIVCDDYAYTLAEEVGIAPHMLIQINNPYLEDVVRNFHKIPLPEKNNEFNVLYISEPVADDLKSTYGDANYWGYTEYDIVSEFVNTIENRKNTIGRIRLHPNEKSDKYNANIEGVSQVYISDEISLLDDLVWSDIVVGVESMALVVAISVGKKVYSWLPACAKKKCCLPHRELTHIDQLYKIFN